MVSKKTSRAYLPPPQFRKVESERVLTLKLQGYSVNQIADMLHLSLRTVNEIDSLVRLRDQVIWREIQSLTPEKS